MKEPIQVNESPFVWCDISAHTRNICAGVLQVQTRTQNSYYPLLNLMSTKTTENILLLLFSMHKNNKADIICSIVILQLFLHQHINLFIYLLLLFIVFIYVFVYFWYCQFLIDNIKN